MTGLIIDNFAGGGGASTGIEQALGRMVDIAINHDAEALRMHAANHPGTHHLHNNIWHVDPLDATQGKPVDLAWFSPDCKHFSKAKGGKPREKSIRDLAWVVVHWVKRLQDAARRAGDDDWRKIIKLICIENVEEFKTWGPLCDEGKPIKDRAGEIFDQWCAELRKRGGKIEFKELRACDYGAPTIRKRFFMVVRFNGLPICWPEPTHGKPGSPEVLAGKRLPWRTAAEIIDWSLPCPSIFERQKPLAEKTLRRIAHGIMKFVVNNPAPFIVPLTHHGSAGRSYGLDQPLPTVTGANRGEMAVVSPVIVGTAFKNTRAARAFDPLEPLRTITAQPEYGVAEAQLAPIITYAQQGGANRSAEDPLHTVCASRKDQNCIAAAHLVHIGNGEREGQAPRAMDVEKPLGTVVGSPKHHAVAAFMQKFAQNGQGYEPTDPLHTVMAGAPGHAVVCAHIEQANGGPNNANLAGRAADEPLSTATASGSQQRLVTSNLIKLRGTSDAHLAASAQGMDEPVGTISAGGTHAAEVRAFLVQYYGNSEDGQALDKPIGTIPTHDRFGLVTVMIEGEEYVIVDIGMRMLSPRELFNAQGFPADYIIDRDANGAPITKTAQVAKCGNSVCPPLSKAIVGANMPTPNTAQEAQAA
jgi:DNA (cytosine-5)-methyltransferase 1